MNVNKYQFKFQLHTPLYILIYIYLRFIREIYTFLHLYIHFRFPPGITANKLTAVIL